MEMRLDTIRIAFFDMDSTIIQNECIDEMARMCDEKHGTTDCFATVSNITANAMHLGLDFEQALHARIKIISDTGFHEEWLEEIYTQKITYSEGATTLLTTLKTKNIHTVLVSGGFTFFTQKVRNVLSFDLDYSNELLFYEGKLQGVNGCAARHGRIIDKEEKAAIVKDVAKTLDVPLSQCLFTGDGGNDAMAVALVAENGGFGAAYATQNTQLKQVANLHLERGELLKLLSL